MLGVEVMERVRLSWNLKADGVAGCYSGTVASPEGLDISVEQGNIAFCVSSWPEMLNDEVLCLLRLAKQLRLARFV